MASITINSKEHGTISVNPIRFVPSGSKRITTNGTHDVTAFARAIVDVQQGSFDLGGLFDEAYLNHQDAIENQDITKLGASALVLPFNAGVFPNNLQGAFIGCEIVYVDDIYNITTLYEAFSGCSLLKHIGLLHASQATSIQDAFAGCEALVDIDGIDGLGTSFIGGEELKLNDCVNLSVQSFINIAKTIAQITVTSYIQVNSEQYDAISVETIEVEGETFTIEDYITNKGWTIEVI